VVAIEGKGLRCAFERARGGSPLALVNAFSSASGLALGQVGGAAWRWRNCCPAGASPTSPSQGATVTADPIHCQRDTAQAILDRDADYLLGLKANRFAMYDDAVLLFDDPAVAAADATETVDADHGLIETRRARAVHDIAWFAERYAFPQLTALAEGVAIANSAGRPARAAAFTSRPSSSPPPRSWPQRGRIGASKTNSIGSWTWSSTKITRAPEPTTGRSILPYSGASPSTSLARTRQRLHPQQSQTCRAGWDNSFWLPCSSKCDSPGERVPSLDKALFTWRNVARRISAIGPTRVICRRRI